MSPDPDPGEWIGGGILPLGDTDPRRSIRRVGTAGLRAAAAGGAGRTVGRFGRVVVEGVDGAIRTIRRVERTELITSPAAGPSAGELPLRDR